MREATTRRNAASDAFVPPFTALAENEVSETTLITSADGIHLTDQTGRRMIDGWSGMACVGLGYGHPGLIAAIADQMTRLSYAHSLYGYGHALTTRLADRLVGLAPESLRHVFFSVSGSDAADTLLKILRYYHNLTGRPEKKHVVALSFGFHGASSLVAGLTGIDECHAYFDLPYSFQHHIPSPRDLGAHKGVDGEEIIARSTAALEAKVEALGPETVAAFVCEPVMVTGGVIVPPPGWLAAMRETCDRLGLMLMVDEVVTGFARTGRMFACEWEGVRPDMMFLAKGMTSGYMPMGAAMFSEEIYRAMADRVPKGMPFAHGFTHTGHPPSAAAALAAIDLYEGLVAHSEAMGRHLLDRLCELAAHPWVTHVRGLGLLAGFDVVADKESGTRFAPERAISHRIQERAREHGVIVRAFDDDMFGLAPPLVITRAEVDALVDGIKKAIDDVRREEEGVG